jgi:hypothetical protein
MDCAAALAGMRAARVRQAKRTLERGIGSPFRGRRIVVHFRGLEKGIQ